MNALPTALAEYLDNMTYTTCSSETQAIATVIRDGLESNVEEFDSEAECYAHMAAMLNACQETINNLWAELPADTTTDTDLLAEVERLADRCDTIANATPRVGGGRSWVQTSHWLGDRMAVIRAEFRERLEHAQHPA